MIPPIILNKQSPPFGYELLLDCYDCESSIIDDISIVYDFLDKAVKVLGVYKQSPPFVFHSPLMGPNNENWIDKAGISAWVPLIESGIQCHTLTIKNFVSIDYYTCSFIDENVEKKLINHAKFYFSPEKIDKQLLKRGVHYND